MAVDLQATRGFGLSIRSVIPTRQGMVPKTWLRHFVISSLANCTAGQWTSIRQYLIG